MDQFLNAIKAQAGALDQGQGQPRFGIVTSVDPTSATARVTLQPEAVLTGWLPVLSPWTGPGWGVACPPTPGDQVLVIPQEGDAEHGVIVGRAYSAAQLPPPAPSGELWLVHRSGTFIKLQNDGTIQISGDLHVAGDIYDRHGSLAALRGHYNQHGHTGAAAPPNPQD
ncbi:MAG: phage baseplate assembly protein V [Acetobacteraceae bacterium]|nr:phage baseplate assembly protein V [Acetobacteraceae bacterium]